MSNELIIAAAFLVLLGVFSIHFEKTHFTSKHIAIASVLAALAAIGRVPFAGIPSVQPTTFIVIITGAVFGSTMGWVVGVTAAVISNLFLGHGPWTVFQMCAWGLCGISAGVLGHYFKNYHRITWTLFGVVWGFIFGVIMNLWYWAAFVYPLTLKSWLAIQITSFWFDAMHAGTNAVLLFLLGPEVVKILKNYQSRLTLSSQQL